MGYIEVGATGCEALIEIANANAVNVCVVIDALVHKGLHALVETTYGSK